MLNKFLVDNYNKLIDIAYNITNGKDHEDLLSFVIVELYKVDKEKIDDTIKQKKLLYYIIRVMINQYHSKTSRYYYKYYKYYEYHVTGIIESISPDNSQSNKEEKELIEKRLDWIENKLKNVFWFDAQVFRIYYREGHSLNTMAKATKINRNTLFKSINNVKKYLLDEK
mgnify:CR=1 FL=1